MNETSTNETKSGLPVAAAASIVTENATMKIKLPPKPTHKCIDENYGAVIGKDLRTGKLIREGKWVKL